MSEIREGDLYRSIIIEDIQFEIRYGYTCDSERNRWEPSPVYPDFKKNPIYTRDGVPFVTVFQDVCPQYLPKEINSGEQWCADCVHFLKKEDYIGICQCQKRRKSS